MVQLTITSSSDPDAEWHCVLVCQHSETTSSLCVTYPLVNFLGNGKPQFLIGDTSSNGGFPIAMLDYRSVPFSSVRINILKQTLQNQPSPATFRKNSCDKGKSILAKAGKPRLVGRDSLAVRPYNHPGKKAFGSG